MLLALSVLLRVYTAKMLRGSYPLRTATDAHGQLRTGGAALGDGEVPPRRRGLRNGSEKAGAWLFPFWK